MRTPNVIVGERVRAIREARGLSHRDLATRLQGLGVRIHHPAIGKVERGERRLDVSELFAFAYALDVSPMHLMVPADDDGRGVDVTPEVRIERSGNLRRWIRGHVSLVGQNAFRFYELSVPPDAAISTYLSESAAHNRLVEAADDLRDAVMRRDPAEVVSFLRRVFTRAHDVARDHMTEEDERALIHGQGIFDEEDE